MMKNCQICVQNAAATILVTHTIAPAARNGWKESGWRMSDLNGGGDGGSEGSHLVAAVARPTSARCHRAEVRGKGWRGGSYALSVC